MAGFPAAVSATDRPCPETPDGAVPTSFEPCCVHTPPLRVYTHAAPMFALSIAPPTMAVFPSADSATVPPCCEAPIAPVPTSFVPCCVHTLPLRVNTHAAPALLLS